MNSSQENRQLAAIMFTDVVGYSSLMHRDESAGLELLHEHRNIVRPILARFRGREIDTIGDGFVVKFNSTLDAVRCGLELQKTFAQRNVDSPFDRKIRLRIGIHVSDVIEGGADDKKGVYGDGVNIAARLHPFSPVGGICISGAVYEQIAGRLEATVTFLGTPKLKGIKARIRVYAVELKKPPFTIRVRRTFSRYRAATAAVTVSLCALMYLFAPSTPFQRAGLRVAVFPFDTVGFSESEGFISDGLLSGVITSLSRGGIHVLAKSSGAALKGTHKTPEEIGNELDIDRLITGTLNKNANNVKVTISVIDTQSRKVVWTEDFEKPESEILNLKNAIAESIMSRLRPARAPAAIESPQAPEVNKEAYLAYLKGQFLTSRRTKDGFTKATAEFERAIAIDPGFAPAYAELAIAASLEAWYGVKPPVEGLIKIINNASHALKLDPNLTEALLVMGEEKAYLEDKFAEAEDFYKKAIASNPKHAMSHQWYAEFLTYRARFKESYREADLAVELDPLNPITNLARGTMCYFNRDYDNAEKNYKRTLELDPAFMLGHYWMGRTYVEKKDYAKALKHLEKAVELSGREPMALAALAYALALTGATREAILIRTELEAASKTRYVSPYFMAKAELALGNSQNALKLLQRSVIEHGNQTVSANVDPELDRLRSNPGFSEIVSQLK
ncbi:MAG: adenylate/guanylate cyclase domain-containing protein [Bdellovibrionia bacterium]